MLEATLLYALALYLVFHVASRAEILSKPRGWVLRVCPGWLTYPLGCALCFSWWLALVLNVLDIVPVSLMVFLAVPVVNMVLDLMVRALIRANEPPVLGEGKTIWEGSTGISTWRASNVVVGVAGTPLEAGQMVQINNWMTPPPPPWTGPLPEGWATWTTGEGPYATTFGCTPLHGRRVRTTYFDGKTGTIMSGFRNGDDCSGSFGGLMYRLRWDPGQTWHGAPFADPQGDVPVKSCTFLDEPFNPLDHEQTR